MISESTLTKTNFFKACKCGIFWFDESQYAAHYPTCGKQVVSPDQPGDGAPIPSPQPAASPVSTKSPYESDANAVALAQRLAGVTTAHPSKSPIPSPQPAAVSGGSSDLEMSYGNFNNDAFPETDNIVLEKKGQESASDKTPKDTKAVIATAKDTGDTQTKTQTQKAGRGRPAGKTKDKK